ncbi:MAG: hypothetical protein JNL32_08665 [Candidatus Kapabacteria bacterium]|nr:hypothetical protein [Candidatus Kapabacteria bacterium]
MRTTLILLVLVLCSTTMYAQRYAYEDENTALQPKEIIMIDIAGGLSTASGDFASIDAGNPAAGFNTNGPCIQARYTTYTGTKVGYVATLFYHNNPIRHTELATAFSAQLPPSSGQTLSVDAASWTSVGISGGIMLNIPVKTTVNLQPRLCLGYVFITSPKLITRIESPLTAPMVQTQDGVMSTATLLQLGGAFTVDLTEKYYLIGDAAYNYSNPKFTNVSVTRGSTTTPVSFQETVTVLNFSIGVGMRL